jgi:hypothetical protein
MVSSENKDTATQLEKRITKSKEVKIVFVEPQVFNVVDDEGAVKYYGNLSDNKTEDECSCPSWNYGMAFEKVSEEILKGESRYVAENGYNFQCKHVIAARAIRYGESAE